MKTSTSERRIAWLFALLSVTAAWQLQFSQLFAAFSSAVGAADGSLLQRIIVEGGVPLSLVALTRAAVSLYEKTLWKWSHSHYRGGWWVYGLTVNEGSESVDVAGYFHLEHAPGEARVSDGHAFYLNSGCLTYRGYWFAEAVWLERRQVKMLFSMRAVNPSRRSLPSHYDGYLEVTQVSGHLLFGSSGWYGHFNDLGDRRTIAGPVYAERLRPRTGRREREELEQVLRRAAEPLCERARQRTTTS